MSIDVRELPVPVKGNLEFLPVSGNAGIAAAVTAPENMSLVDGTETQMYMEPTVMIGGRAKVIKEHLGQRFWKAKSDNSVGVVAGQDAYGVEVFTGGRIMCAAAAVDGCSFGDEEDTTKAAVIAGGSMVDSMHDVAGLSRVGSDADTIGTYMVMAMEKAHQNINTQAVGGAVAAELLVLSREMDSNGKECTYAHLASTGDCSLLAVCREGGRVLVRELNVIQHDLLDNAARKMFGGKKMDQLSVSEIRAVRNQTRKSEHDKWVGKVGISEGDFDQMMQGISGYLGDGKKNVEGGIRYNRFNLSELWRKGDSNIILIAASDCLGDKVPQTDIAQVYEQAKNLKDISSGLSKLMNGDLDDGGYVVVSLGAPNNRIAAN